MGVRRILPSADVVRALLIIVIIFGALVAAFAVFQYIVAYNTLATTPSVAELAQRLDMDNPTNSQIGVVTEGRRRDAVIAQNQSLIIGGIGLIAIGVGWMGLDAMRRRKKPLATPTG